MSTIVVRAPDTRAVPAASSRPTADPSPAAGRFSGSVGIAFLAIALGLALRLYALGRQPLWVDEAATLGIASLTWAEFRDHVLWVEANPPAYYALMKLWSALAPPSEVWLRLPSLLAGTAALPLFYLFCRRAFGPRAAACGVLLLAVAPAHVRFSQEARNYAVLFLLFVGALLAAQAVVACKPAETRRWVRAAALGVLTAGMVYLHATGVVAGAAVYVYAFTVLLARRDFALARLVPLFCAGLGGVLLASPWMLAASAMLRDEQSVMSWQPPLVSSHVWHSVEQVLLAPYLQRLALLATVLQLAAFCWAVVRRGREPQLLGCLAALAFALLAVVLISLVEPILFERTILFTLALWAALTAAGLGAIRRPAVAALVLLLLLAPQARALQSHYRLGHHDAPWDAVGRHLAQAAQPGDALLALGVFEAVSARHYLEAAGGALPIAVLPLGYEGPFVPMARAMVRPAALWLAPGPAEFCAAFGDAASVWILGRDEPGQHRRVQVEAALMAGGARRLEALSFGQLPLEHWSAPRAC